MLSVDENAKDLSDISARLIEKYAVPGPRYTSYPTAVEFHQGVDNELWRTMLSQELNDADESSSVSVYLHLPYCESLCYFCACNKIISKDKQVTEPYLGLLEREFGIYRELLRGETRIQQIHWGGGSPNFFPGDSLAELYRLTVENFGALLADAEVALEIDPRTTTLDQLQLLGCAGFNRISMGVQDFNPVVQKLINRIQPYEMTARVCKEARASGFKGINIDLIYGLPAQTIEGFAETIERVLEIRPDRVALYGYAHVTWIKKVQKALERSHMPTPRERIELFKVALEKFSQAGYRYIGMDHFALPEDSLSQALDGGRLSRNFMGYTTHRGVRIIGCGISAISTLQSGFAQNHKELGKYEAALAAGQLPLERGLLRSKEDQLRAAVIEHIFCSGRLDFEELGEQWQISFREHFCEELTRLVPLEQDGLVNIGEHYLEVTSLGRFFMRNIAMVFDGYLAKHQQREQKVFSQAV